MTLFYLADFYNTTTADMPYRAVVPSIWTSVATNMSLITACLPAIKVFVELGAGGVSHDIISDRIALQTLALPGPSSSCSARRPPRRLERVVGGSKEENDGAQLLVDDNLGSDAATLADSNSSRDWTGAVHRIGEAC